MDVGLEAVEEGRTSGYYAAAQPATEGEKGARSEDPEDPDDR